MPKKDNCYDIERFGDRVNWMARHLQHNEKARLPTATSAEVHRCIVDLGHEIGVERTWQRYTKAKAPIPHTVVKGLLDVFPDLTEDMVTCRAYAEFERKTEALTKCHMRWNAAIRCMAAERTELAAVAKRYYVAAGVDEAPSFPLVVRKDWIPAMPIEMTQTSPVVNFRRGSPASKVARLDGINIDYVEMKARNSSRRPTNGDCYRLMNIRRVETSLEFDLQDTCYFDYINTCEILGIEIADQYLSHQSNVGFEGTFVCMPDSAMLPRRGDPRLIFDFGNRAAFAGVNCFLMIRNFSNGPDGCKKHKFYFHNRTENTLEAQNTLHVVPAGGHQPCEEAFGNQKDVSLWRTAVREFCEELFNKEDAAEAKRDGQDFLERKEVRGQLGAFINSGAAQFYLLGVGLDPLTTKPEFLVAIVVDWPKAQRAGGSDVLKIEANYEGTAIPHDLSREALREILDNPPWGKPWLPAGRACIELAIQNYDYLMKEDA